MKSIPSTSHWYESCFRMWMVEESNYIDKGYCATIKVAEGFKEYVGPDRLLVSEARAKFVKPGEQLVIA
jgi:hypothetical protein